MQKTRLILLFVFLSVALWASQALAAPTQQTNLLQNPSFEDPYQGDGVADSWVGWHRESADPGACSGPYAFRPLWSRETNGALVVDGSVSQHIGNQFDTWAGGVWQTVSVNPGSTYRFTFSSIGRASNEQFPVPSDTAVNLGVRAGIDPNGSGLWSDSDVVWGGAGSPHDAGDQSNWQQFSVEATASGNEMTVFVSADLQGANNCRAHLDVWFDNAQLVEVGPPPTETPPPQPTQPPPPPATNTPPPAAQPTATTAPEETEPPEEEQEEPTETPEPTAAPTDTPEPGGVICVNAFADTNSNGMHEEDEGAMAGVTFTVAQGDQVVGTAVSSGPNAICFDDLDPGTYQVAQTVPNTLQMTTGASAEVEVGEGQTLEIKFGSRQRSAEEIDEDEVASTDTIETADDDVVSVDDQNPVAEGEEGSSLLAMSGLVVLLLAIVLLGVLLFTQLRKRA